MSSVFSMVKQVLADSKEKIAAQNGTPAKGTVKRASAELPSGGAPQAVSHDAEKVAKALDYLADNFHLVVKEAQGDEPQGSHQTQKAPESHQSPKSPGMTGDQAGAGSNQIKSEENSQSGDGVLEAGKSGQATSDKINPTSVEPGQSAFPGDSAGSALETTQEESDRPGGQEEAPTKIAQARAQKLAQLVRAGKVHQKTAAAIIARDRVKMANMAPALQQNAAAVSAAQNPAKPGAETAGGASLQQVAKEAGVPAHMARALINKLAADAENKAQISASSKPELQSAKGADNPAQSQGHEAGEQTPDTKGSDQGRDALSSVKAAINATKGQLKTQRTRSEMGKYLNEPAMSSSHDSVLQQSLENASSAGVKIAATKAMLQKWASESPERAERLNQAIAKVKSAMEGEEAVLPGGGMPGEAMPESVPAPGEGEAPPSESEPVSDAALAAAAQGVTPEDLQMAEAMLEEQMGAAEAMGGGEQAGVPGTPEAAGAPPAEPPAPPAA